MGLLVTKNAGWKASPEQVDYDEMRQRMLASASDIICEKGVSALRLDAMAKHAGIARSTVYRYFDSKEQLVYEVMTSELHQFATDMAAEVSGIKDPVEQLLLGIYGSICAYRTNPRLQRLIGTEHQNNVALVTLVLREFPPVMVPYIQPYFDAPDGRGNFRQDLDIEQVVRWLLNVVLSMAVFGDGGQSAEQELAMLRAMLLPALID